MKRWLPFNLLLCTFCACFVLPLSLNAAPVRQAQVVLQIHNQTKQSICYVYLTNGTTPNWGEDQLGNDTILAGETYLLSINPGNYDLLLVDCEGNLLLDKRGLSINHNDTLPLTAVDVTRTSCEAYHFRGARAWQNDQYDDALADLQIALSCFRYLGDATDEAITLNNIGLVYYSLHRYDEALQSLKASLILRRSVNDRSGESITLDNIGGVYQAQGRYTEALANFEKALTIRQALGDRAGEGATLNHIGLAYFNQGLYTEALAHFRKALAIHQVIGDRATESTTLSNIGGVYHAQGLYIEALGICKEISIQRDVVNCFPERGERCN